MAYQYDVPFHVDLSDRVALVTGGNGGIGGMFCRALAACGVQTCGEDANVMNTDPSADVRDDT